MAYQVVKKNAFTLIEVIISISILCILTLGTSFSAYYFLASTDLNSITYDIATAIETARDYTMNHYNNSTNYGVNFTATSYKIYSGTVFNSNSPIVDQKNLPIDISLSNINFNSQSYIYFQSVTGLPSNSGSLKINSIRSNHTISVNQNGIVNIQ